MIQSVTDPYRSKEPIAKPCFWGQRQFAAAPEWRAVLHEVLLRFDDAQTHLTDEVPETVPVHAVPVGSVAFCTAFAHAQGKALPEPLDYPDALRPMLRREVYRGAVSDVHPGQWCKPIETKAFPAQILLPDRRIIDHMGAPVALDTACWISSPMPVLSEWRVYLLDQRVLGYAQYNVDGPDEDLSAADLDWIQTQVHLWDDAPPAYALDVGRINDGTLALVEVNDAWASGFYPGGSLDPSDYVRWLCARWHTLPPRDVQ